MRGRETLREKAAAVAEMRDRPEDGAMVIQISRHTWDWCLDVAAGYLAVSRPDDEEVVDEAFLRSIGWAPVGNTWYTAEEDCTTPIVFWVAVDRSLRIAGLGDWKVSEPTRRKFRAVLSALVQESV